VIFGGRVALGWVPAYAGTTSAAVAALVLACLLAAALACSVAQAQEYTFDASEFAKKPIELGGYAEFKQEALWLRPDSPLFRLNFAGQAPRRSLDRSTGTLELAGRWNAGDLVADVRTHSALAHDAFGTSRLNRIYEAGARWTLDKSWSLDAGKRALRWGKGYAWSPVAFLERPKDANDPQLAREGYVMAGGTWVRSFPGPLAAASVTALVVPAGEDVNRTYGKPNHANPAAKLYLLYHDTDIDLLWAGKGSRPGRYGFDFSRNVGTNLEVHGEWARTTGLEKPLILPDGRVAQERRDTTSWLLGIRYLTESEVTWIAEAYRNGAGYTRSQYADFVDLASDVSFAELVDPRLESLAQSPYARPNPGRDYAYLRVSAKEPFDWLYVTPAITAITNLRDRSFSLTPEVAYGGLADLELRARVVWLHGGPDTEFGSRPNRRRVEVYARWFF
jgi:hypothetical protein